MDYSKKRQDLQYGADKEREVLIMLQEKYGQVQQYRNKYNLKDFFIYNQKEKRVIWEFELKSRKVDIDTYPSLCFGKNKFDDSIEKLKQGIRQTYIFYLNDELYKWDLIQPKLQDHEYYFGSIANKKRNDNEHEAVFVYTKYLTKI